MYGVFNNEQCLCLVVVVVVDVSILIRAHWLQVVAQLLDAGADITLQNESGETALEVAMESCRDMILGKLYYGIM